jgi:spore maturation protein CgeB
MRVLSIVPRLYYGNKAAVEPMYLYWTIPLQQMGHEVETFDHCDTSQYLSKSERTARLLRKIREGSFEVVLYTNSGQEPIETEALADLSKKTCIVAWNSDDDWQWGATSRLASHFTFMVTTYPHIYEENRERYPNLLLSQWACLGTFSDFSCPKNIDFSFAGAVYRIRNSSCRYLKRKAGLVCFGKGSRLVNLGIPYVKGIFRFSWLVGPAIHFEGINQIWNRSRISYTPLGGGPQGQVLSIKSRIFDMGGSGTLMLCDASPSLERYYEPGRECVTFESLEDCAEKVLWYSSHEVERARIARNYYQRTLREHTWQHRFQDLFQQIGLREAIRGRVFPLS